MSQVKMFAIIRQEKIKSFGQLKARSNHNTRQQERGLEHTDGSPDGSQLIQGNLDALEAWHQRAEAIGFDKSKMRKNAVPGVEWLATASGDWWKQATPDMQQEWLTETMAFIEKKMGKENILQATLHIDETTPHLQVITSAFIEKEIKARGRGSAGKPPRKVWTLSATDYVGGHRSEMETLQTDYAKAVKPLGLRRGIPRKETGARNLNPSKWRAMNAHELKRQIQATEAIERDRDEAAGYLAQAKALHRKARSKWTETQQAAVALIRKWQQWEPHAVKEIRAEIANAEKEAITSMPDTFQPSPDTPEAYTPPTRQPQPQKRRQRNVAER